MKSEAREHLEIERKYEVGLDAKMPGSFVPAGLEAANPEVFELEAVYCDTAEFLLARHRIAVRRRTGGTDAGWHIKARGTEGVHEMEWPVSDEAPAELLDALAELVGRRVDELRPIATISTVRTSIVLRDAAGVDVVEVVDDLVRAHDGVRDVARVWREWEAELLPGADESLLGLLEPELTAAGARPSLSESKIGRAMGTAFETAARRGDSPEQLAALAVSDAADRLAAFPEAADDAARVAQLRKIARNLEA
ncbi:CYTH domain-containing protein [Leucobacter sp. UCMA 4100]|uniref:CYTH domain-containing protein n=1 Tax=Leucobacter sp. UCMA 4100 TaxID=2810534 RepID=UPI0022EAC0D3|nr:CYTH domain-containing protein [Leucobacter sp. UCMA 4100]MDA3147506.1 CYTH domain-containing protein [Leucobacter sp. UCMA 4100]